MAEPRRDPGVALEVPGRVVGVEGLEPGHLVLEDLAADDEGENHGSRAFTRSGEILAHGRNLAVVGEPGEPCSRIIGNAWGGRRILAWRGDTGRRMSRVRRGRRRSGGG